MKTLNRTSLVLLTTFTLLTVVLVLSAWLCDDAYITFRTVENLVDGHGPRWNVLERVQSYTHPLWMFVLAGLRLISGEIYFTSIIFSLVLTIIMAWLLSRSFPANTAPLVVLALLLSKAFVDYSTSGLENPLTHVLVVLVIGQWWKLEREKGRPSEVLRFYFLACLCLLTRQDMVVLLAPVLVQVFWSNRGRAGLRALALGLLPLIVWEIFSVIYYGFPVPNTAYAKLGAGLPLGAYLGQGLTYLRLSLVNDPVMAVILAVALITSAMNRTRHGLLALGVVLYLGYVMRIGGDFMVGRYLTAPFVVSLMVLARSGWVADLAAASWRRFVVVGASLVVFGFLGSQPTLLSGPNYGKGESHLLGDSGVADERAYFYRSTGLLRSGRGEFNVDHPWATQGRRFRQAGRSPVVCRTIGFNGFFAGSEVHVIDLMGLSDPLLARLPVPVSEDWRIGHLQRELPAGYQGAVVEDQSGVQDPGVGELDRKLRLVTRGELFSRERWRVIFGLNFGGGGGCVN